MPVSPRIVCHTPHHPITHHTHTAPIALLMTVKCNNRNLKVGHIVVHSSKCSASLQHSTAPTLAIPPLVTHLKPLHQPAKLPPYPSLLASHPFQMSLALTGPDLLCLCLRNQQQFNTSTHTYSAGAPPPAPRCYSSAASTHHPLLPFLLHIIQRLPVYFPSSLHAAK